MNYKEIIKYTLIIIGVIAFQIFFPSVYYLNYKISPDFMLLMLTFIAFRINRYNCIILGFLIGLLQDTITQIELFGIYAFIKPITVFAICSMRNVIKIWPKSIILILISLSYLLHFTLYYYIKLNGTSTSILIGGNLVVIHTVINFVFLFLLDKLILPLKSSLE